MGRHRRFVDNFWVEDLNNTVGFDVLSQRMREGRKLCKEIEEYLKQRSKIEAQYSKDLQKLNKDTHKEDISGLDKSWRELKLQTENMCHAHDIAAKHFMKLSTEISAFNFEQKRLTKEVEDKVSKLHNAAKTTLGKVNNQHKVYSLKFDENITAQSAVKFNENNSYSVTPKDMEKSRNRANKIKEDLERASNLFKNLVQQVQEEMTNWEKEMSVLCNTFEELDEKRIDHLREYLWQCTNIDSQANVDHDKCCEHVRVQLEKCDIDKDIEFFIAKHSTGNKRPGRVEYKGHSRGFQKVEPQVKDRGRLPSLPKEVHVYSNIK